MIDSCNSTPPCPWCDTPRHVQEGGQPKTWYCRKCGREFEAEDDGDITYGRPEKRMEREERRMHRPHGAKYTRGKVRR
jgi:ribosomal protein L37AE/L43A